MMTLWHILALVKKEFLALLKDGKSRTVVIVPPLVQLFIFGYAASYDLNHVPYAVFNEDRSLVSHELLSGFEGSPNFDEVAQLSSVEEIAPLIDSREVLLVVHIGPRFSSDIAAGRSGDVQLIIDGRNSNTAMVALNYATVIVNNFNRQWIADHQLASPPATLVTRAWHNENLVSRLFIIPGIVGLLTTVVTILVTSLSVAREREQGTFDQLLVTPYRPFEILIGKALPGFIIGLGEASLIVLLAVVWFHIPLRGSLVTLYLGLSLYIISAIGVGLMISSLSVTMQQGLLGAFMFLVPAIILSGFTTPIANMPRAVQYITYLNPLRYLMVILRSTFLEGTPTHLLISQFWPMAVIGAITLFTAASLFRRRLY